jgi:site-specific DNA-methyltransferase (adenine-specific)
MDSTQLTIKEKSRVTKEEWREYTKTVWHIANTSSAAHPAVFPIEIPRRLIKLFTFYGESVLDPFAGIGTTAQAAIMLGRKAVCVDQSKAYVNIMRRTFGQSKIDGTSSKRDVRIVHGDSRSIDFLENGEIDLIVTSPPYWNKANYGGDKMDLGGISGYRQFLDAIRPAFEECYRVLKPGRKMCVVTANVNQHTDHGLLTFPLAADFSILLRDIGFVMINEIVWSKDGTGGKWGSYGVQRPIFGSYPYPPNFLFKNVHEYVLIFAKPNGKPVKGPKVIPYDLLMDPCEVSIRSAGRMRSRSPPREQGKKALSFD